MSECLNYSQQRKSRSDFQIKIQNQIKLNRNKTQTNLQQTLNEIILQINAENSSFK